MLNDGARLCRGEAEADGSASVLCWCRFDASVLVRDRERDGVSGLVPI